LLGLVLELITDASSLTFHVLLDSFWLQWCHSLHTDLPAVFSTHTKAISQWHSMPSKSTSFPNSDKGKRTA